MSPVPRPDGAFSTPKKGGKCDIVMLLLPVSQHYGKQHIHLC